MGSAGIGGALTVTFCFSVIVSFSCFLNKVFNVCVYVYVCVCDSEGGWAPERKTAGL